MQLLFQPVYHLDLRYEWVVGQADRYTCGPAAVRCFNAEASAGGDACPPLRTVFSHPKRSMKA